MHCSSRVPVLSVLATLASLSILVNTVVSQQQSLLQRHYEPAVLLSLTDADETILRPVKRMTEEDDEECKLKKKAFPILAHVLEEVCLLCNELYSHVEANVRARCRSNCFKNPMVGKCMARFAPRDVMDPDNFEF